MQHKRYRIENFLTERPAAMAHAVEPRALRSLSDSHLRRLERGAAELAAAMEAMEKACAFMLGIAERVEEQARELSAGAKSKKTRALACDIQSQMARVYELCNFQDIAGQRIAKVVRLLTGEPDPVVQHGFAAHGDSALINGPRLDGASGHITQDEVDALFG